MAELCQQVALIHSLFRRIYNGATLTDIFPNAEPELVQAYGVMCFAHNSQSRKGPSGRPYHQHPLMVFVLARLSGGSLTEQIAALLHDVPEDMHKSWPGTPREQIYNAIATQFGEEVADMLEKLSNPEDLKSADKKRWQAEQLVAYPHIRCVKVADKLANAYDTLLDTPTGWSADKLASSQQIMVETVEIYRDVLSGHVQKFYYWLKAQEVRV